jgi:phosphatidate cytidylyltransferase
MKTRVISSFVALAFAILVLMFAHTWVLYLTVASIAVGALYELLKAMGLIKYLPECCACFAFTAFDCLIGMVHRYNFLNILSRDIYTVIFVGALACFFLKNHDNYSYTVPFTFAGVTLCVTFSFRTLIRIVEDFPEFGVFAIVLTLASAWLADAGAYFAGTFFGRHKLAPVISPKKTVEGVIGGTVCNGVILLIAAIVYGKLINKGVTMHYTGIFIAGMLCSPIGLLGDLAASVIKRQTGIKDYGKIMPGHGGVMDRFDSVMFIAPFMYWLLEAGWLISAK